MTSPPSAPATVRCRPLVPGDAAALVRLLQQGFPERGAPYWSRGVERLMRRAAELGVSAGTVLESGGALVGTILTLPGGEPGRPRVNLSSWTVDPRFAGYAPLLANRAIRDRAATYVNLSPATHTWATIEAQGFVRYGTGRILALPALMAARPGVRVRRFDVAAAGHAALPATERDLLARHVRYGCLALVIHAPDGGLHPVVVLPWRIRRALPGAMLVWCRDIGDLVRFGGPLGRHLVRHGMLALLVDACEPVDGLPGPRIPDRSPSYCKGPHRPRTGDLADSELVVFGP